MFKKCPSAVNMLEENRPGKIHWRIFKKVWKCLADLILQSFVLSNKRQIHRKNMPQSPHLEYQAKKQSVNSYNTKAHMQHTVLKY